VHTREGWDASKKFLCLLRISPSRGANVLTKVGTRWWNPEWDRGDTAFHCDTKFSGFFRKTKTTSRDGNRGKKPGRQ